MPKKKDLEYRSVPSTQFRSFEEEEKMVVEGYAIVYEERTMLWPGFYEVIKKGACREILKDGENRFYLMHHDWSSPVARTDNSTLVVKEDDKGVFIRAEFPNTQRGKDFYEDIRSGLVDGQSFAFLPSRTGTTWKTIPDPNDPDGEAVADLREVTEIAYLPEFSAVTRGQYSGAKVEPEARELFLRLKPSSKSTDIDSRINAESRNREIEIIKRRGC